MEIVIYSILGIAVLYVVVRLALRYLFPSDT
jgi:hypothetical protein